MSLNPIKIGYYTIATHLGGAERSLFDLIHRIEVQSEGKYLPIVFLPKEKGPLVDLLKEFGIPYEIIPMPTQLLEMSRSTPLRSIISALRALIVLSRYVQEVRKRLVVHQVRLLHTNGLKCHFLGAVIVRKIKIPVLWHLRDIMGNGMTLKGLRMSSKYFKANLVANSKATALAFDPSGAPIPVVYNGINPLNWNPSLKSKEKLKIGILGILAPWKGQIEFLRMARILIDLGYEAEFFIIGGEIYDTHSSDGSFTRELKQEMERLQIAKYVTLTGFVKDPRELLQSLSVLVHASLKPEPFGRVIIEAMASRVPVVAASAGGVMEIIENEKSGLLYTPGNITELSQKVIRLLKEPLFREQLIEQAYQKVIQKFTVEQYAQSVIELYNELNL